MDDVRALKSSSPEVRSMARRKLLIKADREVKLAKRAAASGNDAAAAEILDGVRDQLDFIAGRTRASKRPQENTRVADRIVVLERRAEMLKLQG